ncbi:hypothetical protein [Acinetobacter pollinis]|uniref:Uncharacterized protein n=1 Tax=Acinetobacter pollinis TaxID=2605270 RepID=A0ABU6DQ09_9GAMM|nr:hypothetical protein [Acinetobacter pollinis]MEB5475946.1 hypothetical protein [Acinetobacter pollinis]
MKHKQRVEAYFSICLETIQIVKNNPVCTSKLVSEKTGMSKRSAQRHLIVLEKLNIVRKIGTIEYRWFLTENGKQIFKN